jgi:hypothetical protein
VIIKLFFFFKRFLDPRWQNLFVDYSVEFKPRYGYGKPPHKELYEIINSKREKYKILLHEMLKFDGIFQSIKLDKYETDPTQPVYNNGFLPGLDIFGIYTIISKYKPNCYVEVGSGNSTKVAKKAIIDNALSTEIVSIDPQPRAEIDEISSRIIRAPFEKYRFKFSFNVERK